MKAAVTVARRVGSADHVPAGRRAARISAGVGAAVVLAAVAGVALTFLARAAFKGNDLVFNLAPLAAAVAYAALGALVVLRAGNPIGWLMLAESAGLVIMTLASTYCLLGSPPSPGTCRRPDRRARSRKAVSPASCSSSC